MPDEKVEGLRPSPKKIQSLDDAVNVFAANRIRKMDPKKIVEALRKEGIENIDQLAGAIVGSAGSIAGLDFEDLICFPYYVFRRRNPLFDDDLRRDLEQFEQFAKRQIGG
jgi:hypothetical protein